MPWTSALSFKNGGAGLLGAGAAAFAETTELAERYGAVDLGAGVPDFDPPSALLDAATDALRGGANQYSPSHGLADLREAVARHALDHYRLEYDAESQVTVTAGATEAFSSIVSALVRPGDEVVLVEPCLPLYRECVHAAGGTAHAVATRFPDFGLDPDDLAAAFGPRTRLAILNTPANPSGKQLTSEELAAIGELAEEHDVLLVSDEAYEHVLPGDVDHVPVASDPACRARTLTVSSISKTFAATGWRIGWMMAPSYLTEAVRPTHRRAVYAAPTPLQHAAATMLVEAGATGYLARLRRDCRERRDVLLRALEGTALEPATPSGGYFILARGEGDGRALCRELLEGTGVAALPGSSFWSRPEDGRSLVRFAFCKRVETLAEAGRRLGRPAVGVPVDRWSTEK